MMIGQNNALPRIHYHTGTKADVLFAAFTLVGQVKKSTKKRVAQQWMFGNLNTAAAGNIDHGGNNPLHHVRQAG